MIESDGNNHTSFGQRVRDLLFDQNPKDIEPIDPLSNESIKHLFDSVRNFALVVGVGLGGHVLLRESQNFAHPVTSAMVFSLACLVFGIASILFFLNTLFLESLLQRFPLFHGRSARWAFFLFIAVLIVSLVLVLTGWLARDVIRRTP